MKSIVKHAAPNVVPGTNFNTQRFQELFSWVNALSSDNHVLSSSPNQYGLLISFDEQTSLQLEKSEDLITLRRCCAVTSSGKIIGIFEGTTPTLDESLTNYTLAPGKEYYIMVCADGYQRIPFGPIVDDAPERPQFTTPKYHLHIQEVNQVTGFPSDSIPVGILEYGSSWNLKEYIPPCTQIGANEFLSKKFDEHQEAIRKMLECLPQIIRQTTTLGSRDMFELREFISQCGVLLSTGQTELKFLTKRGQPVELVKFWMSFANALVFLLASRDELMYKLIDKNIGGGKFSGVNFSSFNFNEILTTTSEIEYNQNNILDSVKVIDRLVSFVLPVFKALSVASISPVESSWVAETPTAPKPSNQNKNFTW